MPSFEPPGPSGFLAAIGKITPGALRCQPRPNVLHALSIYTPDLPAIPLRCLTVSKYAKRQGRLAQSSNDAIVSRITRAALTGRGNRGVNVWARYGHGERGAEGPEAALSPRKSQCSRRAWVGHVSDGAASQRPGGLPLHLGVGTRNGGPRVDMQVVLPWRRHGGGGVLAVW